MFCNWIKCGNQNPNYPKSNRLLIEIQSILCIYPLIFLTKDKNQDNKDKNRQRYQEDNIEEICAKQRERYQDNKGTKTT